MKHVVWLTLLVALDAPGPERDLPAASGTAASPVIEWSGQARRAIVPAGPDGVFGAENYGNKFPGEAALYMGIVHMAIYDAARAAAADRRSSPDAAIATAAHHALAGLQPALGLDASQRAKIDDAYAAHLARLPDNAAKAQGIALGARAAAAVLARRQNDGRDKNPQLADLDPPPPGIGIWDPGSAPALGLRLAGIRPLVLRNAAQFRPKGPPPLTSAAYAQDYRQVERLGRAQSANRTPEQTVVARFWTDHDIRQWNDGLLRLATERRLDGVQTARMLAMAHVAGGDAMIACFEAKYAYWFWRPYQAIPLAERDGNAATQPDPDWRPLGATPNFPEYPSAHACHSTATAEALTVFFGTSRIRFSLDSRITGTTREYAGFDEAVDEVNLARVLAGFHFYNADRDGSELGRAVARYVVAHRFRRDSR